MSYRNQHRRRPGPPASPLGWVALLGGPVVWAIHFGARYPLVDVACAQGSEWPLHAVSIACALADGLVLGVALVTMRRARRAAEAERMPDDPLSHRPLRRASFRVAFLARAGVVTASFFLVAILAEAATTIVYEPCTRALLD